jgi:hypothetical protein
MSAERTVSVALAVLFFPDFKSVTIFEKKIRYEHFKCSLPFLLTLFRHIEGLRNIATDLQSIVKVITGAASYRAGWIYLGCYVIWSTL